MQSLIGQSIGGRYFVAEKIGEGGMAAVYRVYDTSLERDVALKVILPSQETSELFLKRFEREAKALARMMHPNIVHVHDYGEYQGVPFVVMDYLSGGSLDKKYYDPLPYQDAIRLLIPIAKALDYAHQNKIIHRDVKPHNILLTESGEPMLTDFGIIKMLEEEDKQQLTKTGVGLGTPIYMAPEQGTGVNIDGRSDMYSLAIVLYELVTGKMPFNADTPMGVLVQKMTSELPDPRRFVPDLPDTVVTVLEKALQKEPGKRFPNMQAFIEALEDVQNAPVGSTPSLEDQIQLFGSDATMVEGTDVVSEAEEDATFMDFTAPIDERGNQDDARIFNQEPSQQTVFGPTRDNRQATMHAPIVQQTFGQPPVQPVYSQSPQQFSSAPSKKPGRKRSLLLWLGIGLVGFAVIGVVIVGAGGWFLYNQGTESGDSDATVAALSTRQSGMDLTQQALNADPSETGIAAVVQASETPQAGIQSTETPQEDQSQQGTEQALTATMEMASKMDAQYTETAVVMATQNEENRLDKADFAEKKLDDAHGWHLSLYETFSNNQNEWDEERYEIDELILEPDVRDGVYQLYGLSFDSVTYYTWYPKVVKPDFYITIDTRVVEADGPVSYSLIFRRVDEEYYDFAVTNDGGFFIGGNFMDEYVVLKDWAPSDVIRTGEGEWNKLTVIGEGVDFYFYINEQFVAYVEDKSLSRGDFGFAIGYFEADIKANFEFDNFYIFVP
ncbi:MAG: protein kinase [Anaerolineaceae bacterium]|nr:protein kinase [Anaerolineaceae bacterium]